MTKVIIGVDIHRFAKGATLIMVFKFPKKFGIDPRSSNPNPFFRKLNKSFIA
jgi:hypothetical protein